MIILFVSLFFVVYQENYRSSSINCRLLAARIVDMLHGDDNYITGLYHTLGNVYLTAYSDWIHVNGNSYDDSLQYIDMTVCATHSRTIKFSLGARFIFMLCLRLRNTKCDF